jgi:hypothetical protein
MISLELRYPNYCHHYHSDDYDAVLLCEPGFFANFSWLWAKFSHKK